MPGINGLPPGLERNNKRPNGNPHVRAFETQQQLDAANTKVADQEAQISDLTTQLNDSKDALAIQSLVISLFQGVIQGLLQKLEDKKPAEEAPAAEGIVKAEDAPKAEEAPKVDAPAPSGDLPAPPMAAPLEMVA